jgi:hypothetical protein
MTESISLFVAGLNKNGQLADTIYNRVLSLTASYKTGMLNLKKSCWEEEE